MKLELLDLALNEPEGKDIVVRFWVQWEGSPKTYTFCSVKLSSGLWCTTGADAQAKSWTDTLEWVERRGGDVFAMEVATDWEKML